jgi:regulation of enolase protein 1 (concanavalin A-like superfamily)
VSFGAYLAAFPDSLGLPTNSQLSIDLKFPDTPEAVVSGVQLALEHDNEPWIKAGLEFMHDHRVSINFATNDVNINGQSIPFS